LALSTISTIVPDCLIANVADTIIDVALTNKVSVNVRKKAILCLTRILKKYPAKYDSKKFVGPICEMM
jgi:vesicle coat complex subunit